MSANHNAKERGEKPLVGIPWRTTGEEEAGERRKLDYYFESVRKAGGEPREISLKQGEAEFGHGSKRLES